MNNDSECSSYFKTQIFPKVLLFSVVIWCLLVLTKSTHNLVQDAVEYSLKHDSVGTDIHVSHRQLFDGDIETPRTYKPINCHNSGHFYTEDLPNILYYNVTQVCSRCISTFEVLTQQLSHRNITFTSRCDDPNTHNITYSCYMKWICGLDRTRLFQIIPTNKVQTIYDQIINLCRLHHVQVKYRVLIFHRLRTRKVINMDLLTDELRKQNISYREVNETYIKSLNQCEIFRMYQEVNIIAGSYGSDITYGMLLRKAVFPFMNSEALENFYEVMKAMLGYGNPFKIIFVKPLPSSNGAINYGKSWEERRAHNFLRLDLVLTNDSVNEFMHLNSVVA